MFKLTFLVSLLCLINLISCIFLTHICSETLTSWGSFTPVILSWIMLTSLLKIGAHCFIDLSSYVSQSWWTNPEWKLNEVSCNVHSRKVQDGEVTLTGEYWGILCVSTWYVCKILQVFCGFYICFTLCHLALQLLVKSGYNFLSKSMNLLVAHKCMFKSTDSFWHKAI